MYSYVERTLKSFAILAIASTSLLAHAEIYEVRLEFHATSANHYNFANSNPFYGLYEPFDVVATFLMDDQTGILFGDPTCDGKATPWLNCGAIGYEISELTVAINGVEDPKWVAGVNNNSFFNGIFDTKGRQFFTGYGLYANTSSWLPLINLTSATATLNFGQMYISLGGVGFSSPGGIAKAENGETAFGWISEQRSLYQPLPTPTLSVPEPSTALLLLSSLGLTCTNIRKQKALQVQECRAD